MKKIFGDEKESCACGEGSCGCGLKKGFTLIELLIVIAIIGLLATLAIVSLTTAQKKARDTKRVADMSTIQKALELRYSDCAAYPASATLTYALFSADDSDVTGSCETGELGVGAYITQVPTPPSTTDTYYYLATTSAYVLGTTLEDSSYQALGQDYDTNVTGYTGGISWTSTGTSTSLTSTSTVLCEGATEYCITN